LKPWALICDKTDSEIGSSTSLASFLHEKKKEVIKLHKSSALIVVLMIDWFRCEKFVAKKVRTFAGDRKYK
jgi:hypothetical protein